MPTWAATWRAAASLSPVSRTGVSPSSRSRATASADVGLTVSPTTMTPRARPSQPTATARAPLAPARASTASASDGGRCCDHSLEQARPADDDGVALDDALDAEALAVGEVLDRY